MASKFPVPTFPFSPSSSSSSSSPILYPKTAKIRLSLCNFPLRLRLFSPWSGLKHLDISSRGRFPERRKRIPKGKAVFASLFGVGAPEALVIGVVALLVFGPKCLAEVARTLGKTLRTFRLTIRELQDVSREFKTTLEREIGLDEISSPVDSSYNSSKSNTYSNPPFVPKPEEPVEWLNQLIILHQQAKHTPLKSTLRLLKPITLVLSGGVEAPVAVAPELQNLEAGKVEESTASSSPGAEK